MLLIDPGFSGMKWWNVDKLDDFNGVLPPYNVHF